MRLFRQKFLNYKYEYTLKEWFKLFGTTSQLKMHAKHKPLCLKTTSTIFINNKIKKCLSS